MTWPPPGTSSPPRSSPWLPSRSREKPAKNRCGTSEAPKVRQPYACSPPCREESAVNGTATSITQLNRLNVIQDGGKKLPLTFSDAEFDRRLVALRGTMETENPATSFLEPGMVVSM